MTRMILLVGVFLLPSIQFLYGQGSLRGRVYDDGKPVPFATIGIPALGIGATSDSNGFYVMDDLPAGVQKIEVKALGFQIYRKEVKVVDGVKTSLDFYLKGETSALKEVVISGTLNPVERLESAIPVEVYHPSFFKRNPTPGVFEALHMVNGVQPQINCNVCNTGDIHINGMEGPYTMVLIDGMPIVSSLSSVYGLSGIPNAIIRRIEIVKGPAGTLYGSEAMGGLINIITKEPHAVPRFFTELNATSTGEVNLDVTGKWKAGRWSSLLGVNTFHFSNARDINDDNFTDVTLQKRVSVFNKWSYSRKDTLPVQIALRYLYEDRWGGEMQWSSEWRGSDSIYGESVYTSRVEAIGQYGFKIKDEIITTDFSFNRHVQDSWYGIVSFDAVQAVSFLQFRWTKKMGRHELMTGLPVRYTFYDDNTPGTATGDSLQMTNAPMKSLLAGVFIQDEFSLTDQLALLGGIRSDFHKEHGMVLSPRLAARYKWSASHSMRLSSGNGYRVVNLFTEDHAALSGARDVEIVESLKPEQSWNINLNYTGQLQPVWGIMNIDASVFYTYFSNRITGDFLTDPQRIIYKNLDGYAISKGASLNLDFASTGTLRGNVGVTFLEVYQVEREHRTKQLHAPSWSGVGGLTWTAKGGRWLIDITGKLTGPMYLPVVPNDYRPQKSPWFAIMNVQVTRRSGPWEFYTGLKNMLNFIPEDPILRPFDPFDKFIDVNNPYGYTFDPSYNYAPIMGTRVFIGCRYTLG
ncbi:MAG: TonB-dependent receptor [Bacteroidetes bacterium]|nr:TonB-dependent receptor [Bacteroidota bacterium]